MITTKCCVGTYRLDMMADALGKRARDCDVCAGRDCDLKHWLASTGCLTATRTEVR